MHLRLPAILCASRVHGEHGAVLRLLTHDHGLIAAYCAGARGDGGGPLLLPGNARRLYLARSRAFRSPLVELVEIADRFCPSPASAGSRGVCALTHRLARSHPYPALYTRSRALDAICHAPSAAAVEALSATRRAAARARLRRRERSDDATGSHSSPRFAAKAARSTIAAADKRGDVMARALS